MVARASDKPRTVPKVIEQQATDLAETRRAMGRGSTALRDDSGNALVMNPDARFPLLQAQGLDSAVAYDATTVRIMSPDTQEHRDFAARSVEAQNGVQVTTPGAVSNLSNTIVNRQLNVNGPTYTNGINTSSAQVGGVPAPADRQIMTYDLTATHNVLVQGNLYVNGQINPPSERRLKHHVADLGDPFDFLAALCPARFTWRDTEHFDATEHVGVYVDEMAEADPATVIQLPEMPDATHPDPEVVDRWRANSGRAPDERALIAYLVAAATRLHDRVRELENRLAAREKGA